MTSPIILSIINGEADADLDEITRAIRVRREVLTSITVGKLVPGSQVHFSDSIRPKYLAGMTATVVKVNPKSVIVSCPDDPAYGRFRNGKNIRCPNSLIAGR